MVRTRRMVRELSTSTLNDAPSLLNSSNQDGTMVAARAEHQDALIPSPATTRQQADAELAPSAPAQSVLSSMAASLELSSSAAAATQDRLSSIPPELLSKVFESSDYSEPISGPLLAYTRKNRYHRIAIRTVAKLQLFCDFMVSYPELGTFVVALCLSVELKPDEGPPKEGLQAMYRALKNVEDLEVEGRLASLVLSHDVAATCFPKMEFLRLRHPCVGTRNPLDWARYLCLEHYPHLFCLEVTIEAYGDDSAIDKDEDQFNLWLDTHCPYYSDTESEQDATENSDSDRLCSTPPLRDSTTDHSTPLETNSDADTRLESSSSPSSCPGGSIVVLQVTAPSSDPRTVAFIESFDYLYSLELIDESEESDFKSILDALSFRAAEFASLVLVDSGSLDPVDPNHDISTSLSHFTQLDTLHLHTNSFSSALFQHLRDPLPLNDLRFTTLNAPVSTDNLKCLLLPGPGRLTALKRLEVDVIGICEIGTRVGVAGPYCDDDGLGIHPDWELPYWQEGTFELDGAVEVVRLAREAGVEVVGDILDAIKVEHAWEDDMDTLAYWGESDDEEEVSE